MLIKLIQRDTLHKQTELYYPWHFTYFHGVLEEWVYQQSKQYCADLVAGNIPLDQLTEGIYKGECYSKPVTIYLWKRKINKNYSPIGGLIVDSSSEVDIQDAKKKCKNKQALI